MISLTIAGTDRTDCLRPGSAQISRQMQGRATAGFDVRDPAQSWRPVIGDSVILTDGGTTFGGLIDSITEDRDDNLDYVRFHCECLDAAALFDRRLVARTYPAGSFANDIVFDIVANFLSGEDIDTTNVTGYYSTTDEFAFDYRTVTECLNTLCESSPGGDQWWVVGTDLYMKPLSSAGAAPFNITDTSSNWRNLTVEYGQSESYRNRQYVRTGANVRAGGGWEETTIANGAQWGFPTQFPIMSTPTLTIDGVGQTVRASDETDAFTGWYYFRGGCLVVNGAYVPPAAGAVVVVSYGSFLTNVVMVEDTDAQAARRLIEGGSGIHEVITEAHDVTNYDAAMDLARGLLIRCGGMPITINYETDSAGLEPGQKQTVTLTANALNQDFFVSQISSQAIEVPFSDAHPDAGARGYMFRNAVTLSVAQDQGDYLKWWMKMYQNAQGKSVPPIHEIHGWNLSGTVSLTTTLARVSVSPISYQNDGYLYDVNVLASDAAAGPDFEFDVRRVSDGVSILGSSLPTLPDGSVGTSHYTTFANAPQSIEKAEKYELWARYTASGTAAQNIKIQVEVQH